MEKLEKHEPIIKNIKIDRLPQLRCLQNILELSCIDTSYIEKEYNKNNNFIVEIVLDSYTDESVLETFGKIIVYTKVTLNTKQKLKDGESFSDMRAIDAIIKNSKIYFGESDDN